MSPASAKPASASRLKTRMDLFRKSLADYLTAAGEHEVARLFTEQA